MTQPPPESDLHNDLQQFLYDARDQFLALENIRGDLREIADTTVSQRKAFAASLQKLDRAIHDGVSVTVNAGLTHPVAQLSEVTTSLQSIVATARHRARLFLYALIGLSTLSAFIGAAAGLYITARILW